jgi:hypothetical protein
MGWLKLGAHDPATVRHQSSQSELKATTEQHMETLSIYPERPKLYPRAHLSVPDLKLPFIPPDEVPKRTSAASGGLCEYCLHDHFFELS